MNSSRRPYRGGALVYIPLRCEKGMGHMGTDGMVWYEARGKFHGCVGHIESTCRIGEEEKKRHKKKSKERGRIRKKVSYLCIE